MIKSNKKFNVVYQVTNKINNKLYIGCHQTNEINDGYMGSGLIIKRALKKYGAENFKKIILENFDNAEQMFKKEKELVNEKFIKRKDTYNIAEGGGGGFGPYIPVKDKDGNILTVFNNDPRYLSGELISITCGRVIVKDKKGNIYNIEKTDPRYISGELTSIHCGKVVIKDKNDKRYTVDCTDPRLKSGELVGCAKGTTTVKDVNGNYCQIPIEELKKNKHKYFGYWTGKRHTKESKIKIGKVTSKAQKGKGNSQYGTCWIHNIELKESKRIKKEELQNWVNKGWLKGRKIYFK